MKHRLKAMFGGAIIGVVFVWLGRQSGALPASWSPFIMGALGGIASAVLAVGWTEDAVRGGDTE